MTAAPARSQGIAWAVCAAIVVFVAYKTVRLCAPEPPPPPVEPQSGYSAAALSAPAAPRNFGGSAIGEASPAKPAYTNEDLQKDFERQKAALGIRRIITPNPVVRSLRAVVRSVAADSDETSRDTTLALVGGKTTTLLSQPRSAGRSAAAGALVQPEDFSGGPGLPARRVKAPGEPLSAASAGEAGQAVYSMEEATRLWREQALGGSAPSADFSREMLVVVFGQAGIESVASESGRIVVSYRTQGSAPRQNWRAIPRSDLPVVFQPVP